MNTFLTRGAVALFLLAAVSLPTTSNAFFGDSIGRAINTYETSEGQVLGASSGLTESQIQAILSLLQSFGADQETINSVESALRGTVSSTNLTQSQINSILSLLQSFGATSNVLDGALAVMQGNSVSPVTHSLTNSQVQSILSLLTSFGAYSSIIQNMASFLGSATIPTTSSGSGTLTASIDASSPSYAIAAGGTSNVPLGVFKFSASGEDIILQQVRFALDEGKPTDLVRVTLWQGQTKIGEGTFVGNNYATVVALSAPIRIYKDTDASITVKGDLTNIGSGQPGSSGALIRLGLQFGFGDFYGLGASSGTNIQATGNSAIATGVRMFRSFPFVYSYALPVDGVEDGRLMRFAVGGDTHGSINLGRITLSVLPAGLSLSNVKVYGYTDSNFSLPISGQESAGGINTVAKQGGIYSVEPTSPIEVPAGQSRFFEVRASVSGATSGSSVTTKLLGDVPYGGTTATLASFDGKDANFIWSPNTFGSALFSSVDWAPAYGVNGLPTSGIIKTRSGSGSTPTTYACSDGVDNDSDGLVDYPSDPGCSSNTDNDEYNVPEEAGNGEAPGSNAMSCANPPQTGLGANALACYGVWDYGSAFGNDRDMCGSSPYSTPQTGCSIQTNACASGWATATKYWKISNTSQSDKQTIAQNLLTSVGVVNEHLVTAWEYRCTVSTVKKPDLTASKPQLSVSSPGLEAGNYINFESILRNVGNAATSGNFSAEFQLDIGNNGSVDVTRVRRNFATPIPATGSVTRAMNWTAQAGTHSVRFCADTDNEVAESNEGNNCSTKYIFTVEASLQSGTFYKTFNEPSYYQEP